MIRKIVTLIISLVIFILLWTIFLIPIQFVFLSLVGIVGALTGLAENGVMEPSVIRLWESVARILNTALSWYITYKIYKKISIDNFDLKTIKTKNNLFFLLLILICLISNIFLWEVFFT